MFANSGTFRDVSGNGHDAAIIGDPIIGHDGPFGLSDADIEVNRYNYVQVPNLNPLIGDSSRTIEFWFRIGRRPTEEPVQLWLPVSECCLLYLRHRR